MTASHGEEIYFVLKTSDILRLQHPTGKEFGANLHLFTGRTNPPPPAPNLHPPGIGSWQKTRGRCNPVISRDNVENKLPVMVSENKVWRAAGTFVS